MAASLVLYGLVALIAVAAADLAYQVVRKPTELFFPLSGVLYKTPAATWRAYGPLFRRNSTELIDAPLLAALAQVEGSGNPLVRTYWRWSWSAHLLDIYRPASSAVGMYQITDSTFAEASPYCIHHHQLVHAGPWDDWHSCWFNRLYLRIVPADAVELTAAYLELKVSAILAHAGRHTPMQVRHLAAVVHLCGAGAAAAYAHRGFQFSAGQRCGDHDPREYLARVDAARAEFLRLAEDDAP
ncbi:MAG: lytic transglycosylase domain-containing protein [Proteobacteria bacterium]|nr:lytic transglycosylase domain-containing protein [Pseudomonadota bacterium]